MVARTLLIVALNVHYWLIINVPSQHQDGQWNSTTKKHKQQWTISMKPMTQNTTEYLNHWLHIIII